MLVLGAALATVVAAATVTAAADYAAATARARAAADASALAAAGTSPLVATTDGEPVTTARRVAHANAAVLTRWDDAGWPLRFTVTVEVAPTTRWVRRLVGRVSASATGAVRPVSHAGAADG